MFGASKQPLFGQCPISRHSQGTDMGLRGPLPQGLGASSPHSTLSSLGARGATSVGRAVGFGGEL